MSICLITGLFPSLHPAYAASEFTSQSPFSGTSYGKGADNATYTHNGNYAESLIANGIDISYWQHLNSNWETAKKKGVDFAILRVSYTTYGSRTLGVYNDSKFEKHYNKIKLL
jgi:GH25 family lysozyme M1 (1,4-beta-N-acetylmuramidase)